MRDYIHISDLASAHLLALEKLASSAEPARLIYNLGNGRGYSVKEVVECARKVTGHPIPRSAGTAPPGRPGGAGGVE